MIPVRLKMRNFMCYRENVPALDFRGVHLACLSGDNGNGKSAIIDALTWALWGKARAGGMDDLIHSLAPEMEVEFDFNVGPDLYRVIRKRTRPKKRTGAGQSSLDFLAGSGETFRNISGNNIDETQKKIIDTLHMDYDTFTNSAYLRQGHADEFTRQPAGKRKEVLGAILDLGIYKTLEDKAKTLAREHEEKTRSFESGIAEMAEELARRPEYEDAFARAQETLAAVEAVVRDREQKLNDLRRRKEALETRQSQLDEMTARTTENTRLLKNWEEQAEQYLVSIRKHEQVIARKAEIEAGYAGYTAARKNSEELAGKFQQSVSLERRKAELEKSVAEARNELLIRKDRYQQEIERLETRVKALPELREQMKAAEAQVKALAEREKTLKTQDEAVRESQRNVSLLEAESAWMEREIGEVTEKLDLLARHRETHTDALCPLCESELTGEGLALIEDKYTTEKGEKTDRLEKDRAALTEKRASLEQLEKEHAAFEAGLKKDQSDFHARISVLEKGISDIGADEERLAKGRVFVAEVEEQMKRRDYAVTEQEAVTAVESELAALGYDAAAHERAQADAANLQPWEPEKTGLDEAERLIDREKDSRSRAAEEVHRLQEDLKQGVEKQAKLTEELEGLPALRGEADAAEKEYRDLDAERRRASEEVGSVRERLERLAAIEKRKKEREKELDTVAKEAGIYRELVRAFGKDGIQALMIDTALPEIESEANRLLSRMTDNRMHVRFESQRKTKTGKDVETLDITITDELGTRNYEMFSGGEAFRINFAIRIALSRLLANRAQASLPTLIIDEGFGTQDSTGMEKLKEAINSIQDDFEKILVITHMDELKDAFPARIDVVKTGAGSTITVS